MPDPFVEESIALLARTPASLNALLRELPEAWTLATDGPGTWSAYDVLGHLIHGEQTDWIPRIQIILDHGESRSFDSFDREAQFRDSQGKSLLQLLDEFASLRAKSLETLRTLHLAPADLVRIGRHPALGEVSLRQLIATWTAHDLAHLLQISRTMARRYQSEVGPWAAYLSVMQR